MLSLARHFSVFLSSLVAVSAVIYSAPALANSCATCPDSTLQEEYEQANSIVVAMANCPPQGCYLGSHVILVVLEVLKDSIPPSNYRAARQLDADVTCGLRFVTDDSYLLFLDKDGTPRCVSGSLTGGAYVTREKLRVLREYRDGIVGDLSDPWIFRDDAVSCSVGHRFKGGTLGFVYRYDPRDIPLTLLPRRGVFGPDGESLYETAVPSLDFELPQPGSYSGPAFPSDSVSVNVNLVDPETIVDGSVSIKIGEKVWAIYSSRAHWRSHVLIMQHTAGDPALEILEAVGTPADVVISAVRSTSELAAPHPVRFVTRTTQFPNAAQRFKACVDGRVRVGKPRSDP